MEIFAVRVFLFTFLPLLLAGGILLFDRSASTRIRRLETGLVWLFGLGVAGGGIGGFIAHFFFSDAVAEAIGWPTGSPFQLEIAFANLAIGLLGLVATGRRDGVREATVIAATTFSVGASIVHFMDILATGNLAPGNTIQNIANLVKPAFLIPLLVAIRRAERVSASEAASQAFAGWRAPLGGAIGVVTALVSTAFAIGFAIDLTWEISLVGVIAAFVVVFVMLRGSPAHQAAASSGDG
jgi:hypothetical protein